MPKIEEDNRVDYLTAEAETDRVARLSFAEQQERESSIAEFLLSDPDYQQAISSVVGTVVEIN